MEKGFTEELKAFVCGRIDGISNNAKLDEKYLEYKSQELEMQNQFKNELSEEQQKRLIKLLDTNYLKEAVLEEYLYEHGIYDGIQMYQKFISSQK